MLKVALILFAPALLLASERWPVQFTETTSAPEPRSFEASGAYGSVRVDHNGWFQGRGGFRFRNAASAAEFETPPPFTKASYFVGRDPKQWKSGIPVCDSLRERGVYRGIDAVYRSHNEHLEIDVWVKPGANPAQIALQCMGAGSPRLERDGSLRIDAMRLDRPFAYQIIGGRKRRVACSYIVHGAAVRFALGPYDRARELVIDPEVIFSQVSSRGIDAITTDRAGNVYTAWRGRHPFEPTTPGAYVFPNGGSYISKEDAHGRLLWTAEMIWNVVPQQSLGIDDAGNVYIAGTAIPKFFPLTSDALPFNVTPTHEVGFVSEISADGSKLEYSTLFGLPIGKSDGIASVAALAISGAGQITIAGMFLYLTPQSLQPQFSGSFVGRISQDRTHFDFVTPLAGAVGALALDSGGNAIVGGSAFTPDPGVPSLQSSLADVTFYASKDGGATLATFSDPRYPTSDFSFDPAHPDSMLRATGTGVLQSEDGGINWNQIVALGSDYFYSVWIDPANPTLRFASTQTKLYRSEDGGDTWAALPDSPTPPMQVQSFRADGSNIIAADLFTLFVSLDGGKTWPTLNPAGLYTPLCCAIDPSNPNHYLVGSWGSGSLGGIFDTQDGGGTFNELTRTAKVPLVFDPKIANRVYGYDASVPGDLYGQTFGISEDAGLTWRLPTSGVKIPVNRVAADPSGSGSLYGFGSTGVYRSTDRGENWAHVPGELGNGNFNGGAAVFGSPDLYAFGTAYGDGYVAKLDSTGKFLFSTLLGGRNSDGVESLALLPNGDIIAAGWTFSDDMLTSLGMAHRTTGGSEQGFLATISADGSALLAFRYVGGNNTDFITSVAILSSGEIAIEGNSTSENEPDITSDAIVPRLQGSSEELLAFSPRIRLIRAISAISGLRVARSHWRCMECAPT